VIHLVGPVTLAAALAGVGVYGLLARRNAVLVLIGAELILNSANVLLVTANAMPAGGLAAVSAGTTAAADPLLPGQVMAIFVVTIAAAEIGLALAVILLLYRRRTTSDLGGIRELGETTPSFRLPDDAGSWPDDEEAEAEGHRAAQAAGGRAAGGRAAGGRAAGGRAAGGRAAGGHGGDGEVAGVGAAVGGVVGAGGGVEAEVGPGPGVWGSGNGRSADSAATGRRSEVRS
jgi:NADH-quinone oxidoreductase subunit K